jgi:hypothetical protein
VLAWEPEKVIVAHGRWYDRDGPRELRRVSLAGGHTGVDLLSAFTTDIKYLAGSWVGLDDLQAGASENCCEVAENIFVP